MLDERECKRAFRRFLRSINNSTEFKELELVYRNGQKIILKVEVAKIEKPRSLKLLYAPPPSVGAHVHLPVRPR